MSQTGQFQFSPFAPPIETLTGNSGGAVGPTAGNINVVGSNANNINIVGNPGTSTLTASVSGTTTNAVQTGNASGSLTSLSVGTNGQVLLGATNAAPAFATLTSTGGSLTYTTGANSLNIDIANYASTSFTPNLQFGGASTGITYTTQTGTYSQLGNVITFTLQLVVNSVGSATGTTTITTTLPGALVISAVTVWANTLTYTGTLQGFMINGTNTIRLSVNSGGTSTNLANTAFTTASNLIISGSYNT